MTLTQPLLPRHTTIRSDPVPLDPTFLPALLGPTTPTPNWEHPVGTTDRTVADPMMTSPNPRRPLNPSAPEWLLKPSAPLPNGTSLAVSVPLCHDASRLLFPSHDATSTVGSPPPSGTFSGTAADSLSTLDSRRSHHAAASDDGSGAFSIDSAPALVPATFPALEAVTSPDLGQPAPFPALLPTPPPAHIPPTPSPATELRAPALHPSPSPTHGSTPARAPPRHVGPTQAQAPKCPRHRKVTGPPRLGPDGQPLPYIPYSQAAVVGKEKEYMAECIASGRLSGDGPFTERCEQWLEGRLGVRRALMVTSCTDALELAAMILDLSPGDEVIVPSFTFVSSANAFAIHGARPVFIDVQPDTLNLDPSLLEAAITPRTRAIVLVHYGGGACDMEAIMEVADRRGVMVIEDNAHSNLGKYNGRYLGTFGALATLSFHDTKNIICGEGGALLINDPELVERAEVARCKGTDRPAWLRGETCFYSWVAKGSSFGMADILAAFLFAQFECADEIQARRAAVWTAYGSSLLGWAAANGVVLPPLRPGIDHAYHIFHLILPTNDDCDELQAHLRTFNVSATTHYMPLHLSVAGRAFGGQEGTCPVSEDISRRLLRLPIYDALSASDVCRIINAVLSFHCDGVQASQAKANSVIPSTTENGHNGVIPSQATANSVIPSKTENGHNGVIPHNGSNHPGWTPQALVTPAQAAAPAAAAAVHQESLQWLGIKEVDVELSSKLRTVDHRGSVVIHTFDHPRGRELAGTFGPTPLVTDPRIGAKRSSDRASCGLASGRVGNGLMTDGPSMIISRSEGEGEGEGEEEEELVKDRLVAGDSGVVAGLAPLSVGWSRRMTKQARRL